MNEVAATPEDDKRDDEDKQPDPLANPKSELKSEAQRFDKLLSESRSDKFARLNLHLRSGSEEMAAACKLLIEINQEHPISLQDVESFASDFMQVQALLSMIKSLVRARIPLAFSEKQKEDEDRGRY